MTHFWSLIKHPHTQGFNSSSSDEEDDHASDPNWSTRKRARKAGQKKKEK